MVSNELRKILTNLKVTECALTDQFDVTPTFFLVITTTLEAALCQVKENVCITLEVDVVRQPEATCTPVSTTTVTPVLCRVNCRSWVA